MKISGHRLKPEFAEISEVNKISGDFKKNLPDEIALNKFVNYHVGCSPTEIKRMSDEHFRERLKNSVVKSDSKVS
jgi:hypothetical protein